MCNYNINKRSPSEIKLLQAYLNVKNMDSVLIAYGQLCNMPTNESPSNRASPNLLTMRLQHMKQARDSEAANIKKLTQTILEEQSAGGNCLFCIIKQLVTIT